MRESGPRSARFGVAFVALALAFSASGPACCEDWPAFRHDNTRSGVSSEDIAALQTGQMTHHWTFVPLHAPEPAWPDPRKEKARVRFDDAFHVAAAGDAVYFGSSADNCVYCLDSATGEVRWSAFTGGPIRVAPAVAGGRVYVGSDDGCAYCFEAASGELVWKVRASFSHNRVLGNGKMISLWPVRTGVLVDGGVAYFGAGVFPHESVFLMAVDANDGSVIWCNDNIGETEDALPYGGVSPQGPMLASEQQLFVPSSRAMPAVFSRETGKLLRYINPGAKLGGTWALLTGDRVIGGMERKQAYNAETGARESTCYAWFPGLDLAVCDNYSYMLTFDELVALDRKAFAYAQEWRHHVDADHAGLERENGELKKALKEATGDEAKRLARKIRDNEQAMAHLAAEASRVEQAVYLWRRPCPQQSALIVAGDAVFVGGEGSVAAVQARSGEQLWSAPVDGTARGLAAANGKFFVSTDSGRIYCFGGGEGAGREVRQTVQPKPAAESSTASVCKAGAVEIITRTGVNRGFCLVAGSETGELALALAQRTDLDIVVAESDAEAVARQRGMLKAAGLYGTRVVVDRVDLDNLPYSDYFANLVVSERVLTSGRPVSTWDELNRVLKPCGGKLFVGQPDNAGNAPPPVQHEWESWMGSTDGLDMQLVQDNGTWLLLTRGPLEGAGVWTHQYADTGNTACSQDELVRGPLGVLWFGKPGPESMVERHARAAAPLAMDGRMFIQGEHQVMAYDAYNGVHLWTRQVPGAVRIRVDSDMSNLALDAGAVYVAAHDTCHALDPATGQTLRTYPLPGTAADEPRRWGYIAVADNTLFGTAAEPLAKDYGEEWYAAAAADETPESGEIAEALAKDQGENPQDFWRAQYAGDMWRSMNSFPAWGSVAAPEGAVTERIMASDALFAVDAETGNVKWVHNGGAIAHPAIAIANGTVYLADCEVTDAEREAAWQERQDLMNRGIWDKEAIDVPDHAADIRRVTALNAADGSVKWSRVMDLTGCGGDRLGMASKDSLLCFFGCFSNHDRGLFTSGRLGWRRITVISAEDGSDVWSKPLNYLRRPVIIGDEILIEPRMCSLQTGEIKTRTHPLTGEPATWEFVRPGHCCSITSACTNMFFLRGNFMWYYDLLRDQGMLPFGGIRPGCWLNILPANGVLLFPEASAGCTCSFPIRSTVALKHVEQESRWSFIVQHGRMTPATHMAVNFGAPGDWRDEDGVLWFGYPHPPSTGWHEYGCAFDLRPEFDGQGGYWSRNMRGIDLERPWLHASGCRGLRKFTLPLRGDGDGPANYTVRLHFAELEAKPGECLFDVMVQGKRVAEDFDPAAENPGKRVPKTLELSGIAVEDGLEIELIPKKGLPCINGAEAVCEKTPM